MLRHEIIASSLTEPITTINPDFTSPVFEETVTTSEWPLNMLNTDVKTQYTFSGPDTISLPDDSITPTDESSESVSWRLSAWSDDEENNINRPYNYLISHPGKDIRKKLLEAFNCWLNVDKESLEIINQVVSMLHNASLLIDDIQDDSRLRRGQPVAHLVFGEAQTINSANYTYFEAMEELYKLKDPAASLKIFSEEMLNLHRGQGMDLYWRDTLTVPTEEDYMKMVSNKTGGLFRLALRLMMTASSTPCDLLPLSEIIGRLFQIQDDYRNLCSDDYNTAKGFCEDLTEGKFSFLIIHAVRNSTESNNEVLNILKQRTEDPALKKVVLNIMQNKTKTFDYTREVIQRLHQEAMAIIGRFEKQNPLLNAILAKLMVE